MRIKRKDIGDNLAWALQSLPLFDDLFLGMQALNLGIAHEFLMGIERELFHDLIEMEQTPPNTIFVSAMSQLWVFGLYELLRTWRQRAGEVTNFAAKASRTTSINRRRLIAAKKREILSASEPLSGQFRWSQFKRVAASSTKSGQIRAAIDRYELLFRRLEALRVSLAKHELPKAHGTPAMPAMAPGYCRIDPSTGSIRWEFLLQGREVDVLTRRDIAEQCVKLAKHTKRPILSIEMQKKIEQFPRATWHSYGVHKLVVRLRDGTEHPGVFVAWYKEIVGIQGRHGIPFKVEDIVSIRLQ
jgi:hypothetical protein